MPDEKTIWLFKDTLAKRKVTGKLFARFDKLLSQKGYAAKKGQIMDASVVAVPKQRNSRQENRDIKNGEVPGEWAESKRRQKDTDARWTRKNGKSYFGYKNHLSTDVKHKLIRKWEVTPASVYDSQVFGELLDKENSGKGVWADLSLPLRRDRGEAKGKLP